MAIGYPPALTLGYPGWVVLLGFSTGSPLAVRTFNCAPTDDAQTRDEESALSGDEESDKSHDRTIRRPAHD